MAQRKWIQPVSMRTQVRSLAVLSGLRIQHCCELWRRSQMWLRSCVAVAVAQVGSCRSDLTPSLGTSICWRCKCQTNVRAVQTSHEWYGATAFQKMSSSSSMIFFYVIFYLNKIYYSIHAVLKLLLLSPTPKSFFFKKRKEKIIDYWRIDLLPRGRGREREWGGLGTWG